MKPRSSEGGSDDGEQRVQHVRYRTEAGGPAPGRLVEGLDRDAVCRKYQPKVMLLARRLHERLSSELRVALDDLAAVGAIGLLEAFERFDGTRGIQFATFAEYRIRGAMYDALRENDAFSRRRRQLAKKIAAAADDIRKVGGTASADAVAARLGIGLDEYHAVVDRTKPVVQVSIDAGPGPDDGGIPLSERLTDDTRSAESRIVRHEVKAALKAAILELPDRQRQCVMMYYSGELTLAEIAKVFEVTVSRVSQILTEARERLRKKLVQVLDPDDLKEVL